MLLLREGAPSSILSVVSGLPMIFNNPAVLFFQPVAVVVINGNLDLFYRVCNMDNVDFKRVFRSWYLYIKCMHVSNNSYTINNNTYSEKCMVSKKKPI